MSVDTQAYLYTHIMYIIRICVHTRVDTSSGRRHLLTVIPPFAWFRNSGRTGVYALVVVTTIYLNITLGCPCPQPMGAHKPYGKKLKKPLQQRSSKYNNILRWDMNRASHIMAKYWVWSVEYFLVVSVHLYYCIGPEPLNREHWRLKGFLNITQKTSRLILLSKIQLSVVRLSYRSHWGTWQVLVMIYHKRKQYSMILKHFEFHMHILVISYAERWMSTKTTSFVVWELDNHRFYILFDIM